MIREEFFPVLLGANDNLANTEIDKTINFDNEEIIPISVIQGVTGLKVNVRPSNLQKLDFNEVVRFDEELTIKEMMEGIKIADQVDREEYVKMMKVDIELATNFNPDSLKSLAAIDKVKAHNKAPSSSYPVVTFLGTGSSVPSKYRNVTGILVETEPGLFLMLDCGEGTMSQLVVVILLYFATICIYRYSR